MCLDVTFSPNFPFLGMCDECSDILDRNAEERYQAENVALQEIDDAFHYMEELIS
jgi:hypothetical protein